MALVLANLDIKKSEIHSVQTVITPAAHVITLTSLEIRFHVLVVLQILLELMTLILSNACVMLVTMMMDHQIFVNHAIHHVSCVADPTLITALIVNQLFLGQLIQLKKPVFVKVVIIRIQQLKPVKFVLLSA